MITIAHHPAFAALALAIAVAAPAAETDLASLTVQPADRKPHSPAAWTCIYDYAGGGTLPPGTRLTCEGKWLDPVVRRDASGITFAFPDIADKPQAGQFLNVAFAVERPLASYPTRVTIRYTSFHDQGYHERAGWWSPFLLTTAADDFTLLTTGLRGLDPNSKDKLPIRLVGENTLVFTSDGAGNGAFSLNGEEATAFLTSARKDGLKLPPPGAMMLPGIAFRNTVNQIPKDRGDWFAINAFRIEQLRPPLAESSVALLELTVPGAEAVRTTIEVVDAVNDSKGYVLRDAMVAPGTYHLFWDGIDQLQSQPANTAMIAAGTYTMRLTTSKVRIRCVGDMNNSTPAGNAESYGMVDCSALAMTPPGTLAPPAPWRANQERDERRMDVTDSVQLLCVGYDSKLGQWIGADGEMIHGRTGNAPMQHGRGLAVTPPDPTNPSDNQGQLYFASTTIGSGNAVVACPLPSAAKAVAKTFSSPDWNRTRPGFWPYQIRIGQLPDLLGPQHYVIFPIGQLGKGQGLQAEWAFRDIRLYEEGAPDPGSGMRFDATRFTSRVEVRAKLPQAIPAGSIAIEDDGRTVHFRNSISLNYPLEYTVTPRTILAFDVDVIDRRACGPGNGIGLAAESESGGAAEARRFFNVLGQGRDDPRFGFLDPSLGAYPYPSYQPNTLYTDVVPTVPVGMKRTSENSLLWQPGYYGLRVSPDGKLLFACNNADNRLEVRDIGGDGGAIARIPVVQPMFVTWAPDGAAGAAPGTRHVYITSPKQGIVRIAWNVAGRTFGKPETLTPASEFAYPRGIAYSAAASQLFVCDTFTADRSKAANQIVVLDPLSGRVLSRFGRPGGADPRIGGSVDDATFGCPLTIDADSSGKLWVNDYYGCEVRKYAYDPAAHRFSLERRVLGPNTTNISHFYWLPGDPPTRAWTVGNFFVRNEVDVAPDGSFVNQRATAVYDSLTPQQLRPYAHFTAVGGRVLATLNESELVYERVGDGWKPRFGFWANAGDAARKYGLLSKPGEPPTALDKAIAAAGDASWETRPWMWSDLNGDGKIDYAADNPEFQIAFGSNITFGRYAHFPTGSFRSSDGAYVRGDPRLGALVVIPPRISGGKTAYDWRDAKTIPCAKGVAVMDVLAQDHGFFVLRTSSQHHDVGANMINAVECYDEEGKLRWTRDHDRHTLLSLQSLGEDMFTVMDRAWMTIGPVAIRNSAGDLVCQVFCREAGDCWANGALRIDADSAMVGLVQAYRVTGLASVRTATIAVALPAGEGMPPQK